MDKDANEKTPLLPEVTTKVEKDEGKVVEQGDFFTIPFQIEEFTAVFGKETANENVLCVRQQHVLRDQDFAA